MDDAGRISTESGADESGLDHGELLYMMHELSRLISTHFDNAMVEHGLTHAQWWALMHISEHEGQSQSDLARIMQMGRAAASKLLERLEAKGWIERRPDPGDHRVLRVYLHDRAGPVFSVMRTAGAEQFDLMLRGISPTEERALIAGLRKIKANAEKAVAGQGHRASRAGRTSGGAL